MTNDTERTSKPDWVSGYPDYETMVRSWGYEVVDFETFGSYQGDHLALVQGEQGVGLIVFGYGSCSGCDELESVVPWDDEGDWSGVVDLSARLRGDIHWESTRDEIRDWIDANPQNHWWAYDEDCAYWLNDNLGTSLQP